MISSARLQLLALASLTLSAPALATTPSFSSSTGGFSAAFPTAPVVEARNFFSPVGPLPATVFSSNLSAGTFAVSFTDFSSVGGQTAAARLQLAANAQVDGQGGKLLYTKPVTLGAAPGLEVSSLITGQGGAMYVYTFRDYLVGNRLYQVSVATAQGSNQTIAETQALLNSFQLTATKGN